MIVGIRVFTGEDRVKISREIEKELGKEREVFEAENLTPESLPSIFFGTTLFSTEKRKILIKDLSENKETFDVFSENFEKYKETDADVILFETKLDKRLSTTKKLVKEGLEIKEFKKREELDMKAVFNVYDTALRNGKRAVEELEKIEATQDPYMFFGLMVSQALRKLEWRTNGVKEKRALKELSRLDMLMKTTSFEPWVLIKGFLTRLSSL